MKPIPLDAASPISRPGRKCSVDKATISNLGPRPSIPTSIEDLRNKSNRWTTNPHLGADYVYKYKVPGDFYYMNPREAPESPKIKENGGGGGRSNPRPEITFTKIEAFEHSNNKSLQFALPGREVKSLNIPSPHTHELEKEPAVPKAEPSPVQDFYPTESLRPVQSQAAEVPQRSDALLGLGISLKNSASSTSLVPTPLTEQASTPTSEDLWTMPALHRHRTPPSYITEVCGRSRSTSGAKLSSHEDGKLRRPANAQTEEENELRDHSRLLKEFATRAEGRRCLSRQKSKRFPGSAK